MKAIRAIRLCGLQTLIAVAHVAAQEPGPALTQFPNLPSDQSSDPSSHQWATEELSESAKEQLKHICELLTHQDSSTLDAVSELVTSDVSSARLRPQLKPVYSDEHLTIFRPTEISSEAISVGAEAPADRVRQTR